MKKVMVFVAVAVLSIGASMAGNGVRNGSTYLAELVELLNVSGTWKGAPLAGQMEAPASPAK